MPYKYVAYTSAGERVEGLLEVETEEAAQEALRNSNMRLADFRRRQNGMAEIRIRAQGTSGVTVYELHHIKKPVSLEELLPSLYAVRKKDIIIFSRQLVTLLRSGIAILPAFRLLREESTKRLFTKILGRVIEDIQQGTSLSEAFAKHPTAFPLMYVRLIEVGEQTGNLEDILRRLADYLEREESLVRKIRGAMIYPAVIIGLAFVVALLFVNFVIPGMTGLFTEFKAELPLTTRLLLGSSKLVSQNFIQILAGLVILVGGGLWYRRTPQGRRRIDYATLWKRWLPTSSPSIKPKKR